MSRIDEALRIFERTTGAVTFETDAAPTSHASAASEYLSEEPDWRAGDEPVLRHTTELTEPSEPALAAHRLSLPGASPHENGELQARLVTGPSSTVSVEQYRRLAAALHEWQSESQHKTVMITSAVPHEGKTLTLVNLALTLSESYGRRVLVIDADLRSPALHTILDLPNDCGLSEALAERHHQFHCAEVTSRLSALTAGRPGPTPLAGLTSDRMREVLEECATRFDWVLIDTPPVGVLPDAQVLARLVGGILLVIGAGSTPAAAVARAVAEVGGPDAIIGSVLNRVEEQRIPEAGYYGRYRASRPRQ